MARSIIHIDLDAFYCAVEELDHPDLKGVAFAVGGRPDERGVVASCSYPARRHGVRSAMPMAHALRLCPGLKIIPPRHTQYNRVSKDVMACLYRLTPKIEQLSIDEAFIDVSQLPGDPYTIARQLQAEVNSVLRLPCSLGVASNKLVAKIANDVGKTETLKDSARLGLAAAPNAITVVEVGQEAEFLAPLPVNIMWGVGPKTAERLKKINVHTIGDLAQCDQLLLVSMFGKNGIELYNHAHALDDSPIITYHEPKSFSQEITFSRDVNDDEKLCHILIEMSMELSKLLAEKKYSCSTIRLKIRWPDFTTQTRQTSFAVPTYQSSQIQAAAIFLFHKIWERGKAVRLIGIGVSGLTRYPGQLTLFKDIPE